ncbi:MAG: hypothetical protein JWQ38_937 [Flavipsychrobacter sp.]|nr:hypothetical protein [Flavipsychrobacter sp.]
MNKTISSIIRFPYHVYKCCRPALHINRLFFFIIALIFILFSSTAESQVFVSFNATDTAGCAPLVIHFSNTSTGATTYTWVLGNSATSTLKDVSTTYTTAGTYTVTLTAHNGSAHKDTTMIIRAYGKPTVNFNVSDTNVCPGTPINYSSTSVANAWGTLTYTWNFGDGASSHTATTTYTHTAPGRYNIVLLAVNSKGCTNTKVKTGLINIFNTPVAIFGAAQSYFCKYPAAAAFINTATGKAPLTYTWSFGDAATSTLKSPAHTYTTPGSYTVQLQVRDANGCTDNLVQKNYIGVSGYKAAFTAIANGCMNTEIRFTNTSPLYTSAQWDFGDGSPLSDSPIHRWTTTGTYPIKLIAYNDTCYDTIMHPISIQQPAGSFTVNQACTPRSTLVFNATTSPATTVDWIFGDGMGTGANVTHYYAGEDTILPTVKHISMVLTNSIGCKDTVTTIDTIKNHYITTGASDHLSGCIPVTANFKVAGQYIIEDPHPPACPSPPCRQSLILPYPPPITSYTWNFGDGSPASTAPSPSHTFTAAGIYKVRIHVAYANGCTDDSVLTVEAGTTPTASFTLTPTHTCASDTIFYRSTSSFPKINEYFWMQGIPSPPYAGSSPKNAGYFVPVKAGNQPFSLVTGYNGCYSTPYTIYVTVDSAIANISRKYACIPYNGIIYDDYSEGSDSRLWLFDDGTTDASKSVTHYYSTLGVHKTFLTTYNKISGCRDTASSTVDLTRLTPVIFPHQNAVCRDVVDSFDGVVGHASPNNMPTNYRWYNNNTLIFNHNPGFASDPMQMTMRIPGINNIGLVITDANGCLDTAAIAPITVAKPTASFSISTTSACRSTPIGFTDVSRDVTGVTLSSYVWIFGDNTTATTSSPTITHTYTNSNTFAIKEIVTDNIGCKDTTKTTTSVTIHKTPISFTSSRTISCTTDSVYFTNGTSAKNYLWSFGDGNTSTVKQPHYLYATPGSYFVKLTAYDFFGCVDSLTSIDSITVHPNPVASFHMTDSFAVCPPINVTFINTSSGAAVSIWDLGDGNGSDAVFPSNIYTDTGLYKVHLTVYNGDGCSADAYGNVSVFGYAGGFSYLPQTVCTSAPVHFSAPLAKVINLVWDYGDGTADTLAQVDTITHRYSSPGRYVPALILTGVSGCSSYSIGADTIKADTIIAAFSANPDPVCQNMPTTLHDMSASVFSAPAKWLWSFGSGATSTAAAPSYIYTVSGAQSITLQVTDTIGCVSTITKMLMVNKAPDAISGTPIVCIGQPTTLSDAITGGTWTSSNTSKATVGSTDGTVTGVSTGTATITYTLSTGCKTTLAASVNPLPVSILILGSARVCAGSPISLTNTTTGGSWSSSNTAIGTVSSTGLVTSIKAGTTVISYTLPAGCATTVIITVDTMPDPITGIKTVCAGNPTTLTDAVAGGIWTTGNTTIATIGTSNGILNGIAAGTATITYALTTGCNTMTIVTVNALPASIGPSTSSVCVGMELNLTITNTAGAWSSSNTAIAIIGTNGIVTGVSDGTATITYTNPSGCISTKTITVKPVPGSITGITTVCAGSTTTLSDATPGGTWSAAGTAISIDGTTGVITGLGAGTATVSYTSGLGCTATTNVIVYPAAEPISGTKEICLGLTTTLTDAPAGGIWSSTDTTVSVDVLKGIVTGLYLGSATITYTTPSGCAITASVTVNQLPSPITGITYLCPTATTALTDTIAGTWSSSNTTVASVDASSGIVTGVAAGTADILFTSLAGCTALVTVTVYPVIKPIGGVTTLCKGTTTALVNDVKGGVWSSSDTSVAGISSTGVVTGSAVGTATISYSAANNCDTARVLVTVNPLPVAGVITGTRKLCANSSATLNDTITGGVWSSNNNSIAIAGSTGMISGVSAGTVTISYSVTNSCGTDVAAITVTVNPVPAHAHITTHPDTVLCSNTLFQNFGADAPEPAGAHYVWNAVNATVYAAKGQYCLVSFNTSGTSIISLNTSQGNTDCSSADSITFHIGTEESPNASIIYYQPDFVCQDNMADKYQWGYDDMATLDSTLLPGMVNQNYYNAAPELATKNYWVLTYHNGCMQKSYYNTPASVYSTMTANNIEILLYPNPAGEEINIKINGAGRTDLIEAKLFDALGKERKTMYMTGRTGSMLLNGLIPGGYMILFSRNGEKIGQKIFIKH